ncbi:MAG: hypothetical protein HY547_05340 [Elusimicrobia bacterium]|nr:hypothetical protein [Elusimicrobiota bacterium]
MASLKKTMGVLKVMKGKEFFRSKPFGIAGFLIFCSLAFFWNFDSSETLYHVDNVNLARQLSAYARNMEIPSESMRLLGPSYGPVLVLLTAIMKNPLDAMAATGFLAIASVLGLLFFLSRKWHSEPAAWAALAAAVSTPGLVLYARWGLVYLLYSMAAVLIFMSGVYEWNKRKHGWIIVAGPVVVYCGLVPALFFWPANNVVLLAPALIASLIAVHPKGGLSCWRRPLIMAAAALSALAAAHLICGIWYGLDDFWSPVREIWGHLIERNQAFENSFSFTAVSDRFWHWAAETFVRAGGYYNVLPSFDGAGHASIHPVVAILGLAGLTRAAIRRDARDKILLIFFLVPLAAIFIFFDYSPRYASVVWPGLWIASAMITAEIWNFSPSPTLRLAARLALCGFFLFALAQSFFWVKIVTLDNKKSGYIRRPLASGWVSSRPRLMPAVNTVDERRLMEPAAWFLLRRAYAFQRRLITNNDVNPARWAAVASGIMERRTDAIIALGGSSLLPFHLLTHWRFDSRTVLLARLDPRKTQDRLAFIFLNFNDPFNDEWQRFEYRWPPDPALYNGLPLPGARFNLEVAGRVVESLPAQSARSQWSMIEHQSTLTLRSRGLSSGLLTPNQKLSATLFLDIQRAADYRVWCLSNAPRSPGAMTLMLDGRFPRHVFEKPSNDASFWWTLVGTQRLTRGGHQIQTQCQGPGSCLIDRCAAIPVGPYLNI